MPQNNGTNGLYNRITSLLSRIPSNINISSIGLGRNGFSSSRLDSSITRESSQESQHSSPLHDNQQRDTSYSVFGSCPGSGVRIPPPHSHLHRHSSHYPLLLGSYNWSLSRDNRFVTQLTNNNLNNRDRDRNVLSAILSIIVIATLATALAQPKWFSISGGLCNRKYIGLQEFFYVGTFNNYQLNMNKGFGFFLLFE